jgi:hypothetical protein
MVYAPEKYFIGLNESERKARLQEIKSHLKDIKAGKPTYQEFKTDFETVKGKLVRRKTRPSPYTQAFERMFPGVKTLSDKSRVTGIPQAILQKVKEKGIAAARTGHVPGATPVQWGEARVNSFIMKGCTHYSPDHLLVKAAVEQSPKAKAFWSKIKCMCPKGC